MAQATKAIASTRRRLDARRRVIEAYDMVLRRWPDPLGLEHFSNLLLDGALDVTSLATGLYGSDEARERLTHPPDPGTADMRMTALSGLFQAAESGRLMRDHADAEGRAGIGVIAHRVLTDDLGEVLVAYAAALEDGAGGE